MPPNIHRGATLLLDAHGGLHLHVILNDPACIENYGTEVQVVIVSVTSIKVGKEYDDTVVLSPGDHPFIKHPSYVAYRFAQIKPANLVAQLGKEHSPISDSLMAKIIQGALKSGKTRMYIKEALENIPLI